MKKDIKPELLNGRGNFKGVTFEYCVKEELSKEFVGKFLRYHLGSAPEVITSLIDNQLGEGILDTIRFGGEIELSVGIWDIKLSPDKSAEQTLDQNQTKEDSKDYIEPVELLNERLLEKAKKDFELKKQQEENKK